MAQPMQFFEHPLRFLFFTGEGGADTTSLSCTVALQLAGRGRQMRLAGIEPTTFVHCNAG